MAAVAEVRAGPCFSLIIGRTKPKLVLLWAEGGAADGICSCTPLLGSVSCGECIADIAVNAIIAVERCTILYDGSINDRELVVVGNSRCTSYFDPRSMCFDQV